MGIAFRVSEMEARVADIHEKHIFKTVLSPLVNEIRRKRRVSGGTLRAALWQPAQWEHYCLH